MGSLLSRSSSSIRPERTKTRWRRGKQKRFQKMETSMEDHKLPMENDHEQKISNGNLINTHDEWNKRLDQQQISNMNDPPGAPRTYSSYFPTTQNDLMNQSWPASHDFNNQYYPGNSLPMTTPSSIPYDSNQYQQVPPEERHSKKVQFGHPIQQQIVSKNPLTSTQSWHEPSITNNDVSTPTTRQEPAITRRTVMPKTNTSLAPVRVEKPIYVGIDHRATLAERGQTTSHTHRSRNSEKTNSPSTNNHRRRSHKHHQHQHQESNDPSTAGNNIPSKKSFEPVQIKLTGPRRQLTTTSTSTIIPNKQIEQSIFNDNETKISKTRGNRQLQFEHTELSPVIGNDTKSSRTRGNHSQQQQHIAIKRNHSPLRSETTRRIETKQPSPLIKTIPMSQSQQRQQQFAMIPPANITRTRV